MEKEIQKILSFIHLAEKLKTTLRHGWTSSQRQESVAEHSWRLSLMVILCSSHMKQKINLNKAIQMAIIHDLCEVITGDIPFFEVLGSTKKKLKRLQEEKAMKLICNLLGSNVSKRIYQLWEEYQQNTTNESKFVRALDKLEAQIQQNEADVSTWNEFEKTSILYYLDEFCDYNGFLKLFKNKVRNESVNKLNMSFFDKDSVTSFTILSELNQI